MVADGWCSREKSLDVDDGEVFIFKKCLYIKCIITFTRGLCGYLTIVVKIFLPLSESTIISFETNDNY